MSAKQNNSNSSLNEYVKYFSDCAICFFLSFCCLLFFCWFACLFVVKVYIVAVDPQFQFKFLYIYANRDLEKKMS